MDSTTLHLLGYLTPEQWIDAVRFAKTTNNMTLNKVNLGQVRQMAEQVDHAYNGVFSEKEKEKLGLGKGDTITQ